MILLLDERQRKELAQYSPYIAIPKVSSQNRRYIPMDYLEGEIIPGDKLFTMPSATSYEFGILMSNVHMAWTRAVCGRLKSDYSYSNMIVYNNFPWPSPTNDQKEKIRKTAQAILNARALYTDSNLADLYDPLTMPTELLKAHKANNRAVMHAYGFSIKMSEAVERKERSHRLIVKGAEFFFFIDSAPDAGSLLCPSSSLASLPGKLQDAYEWKAYSLFESVSGKTHGKQH